ncbi:MAG: trans-2-enoyl-CoA reductase family protein [Gammaproteobacteria bacterium]|nr:trans-2-enoyl-CoA reductase family protein [Gammaproteobacteria bacterium]
MIVKPRIRGFICTTAHPTGCAAHVQEQIQYVKSQPSLREGGAKRVLVLGCSGGYGLSSRIVSAFGCGAATLGVSFEKAPEENRTATAGWYNNVAFEAAAAQEGLYAKTLDGDAFSDAMKQRVIERIQKDLGQIDLLVYSLASPVRQHPRTCVLHRSSIKPLGEALHIKSVHVDRGEVIEVDLEPATPEETANTVAVMGGEDWEFWIEALGSAGLLATGFRTLAFTYIGTELTWPIYWEGTLGKAKEDLDRAAKAITPRLQALKGEARVAVLKAIVSQASSAIPVVPLYVALLFRVMKDRGLHEDCVRHIQRMFATQLASGATLRLDDVGRIRMDDVELGEEIQAEVRRRWALVNTGNLAELGDLSGFREDFLRIFGFGFSGVDYDAEVDPTLGIPQPAA